MNCPHCNTPLSAGFSFCMNCGSPVDTDATVILPPERQNDTASILNIDTAAQQTANTPPALDPRDIQLNIPQPSIPVPPKKKGKKTGLIIAIVFIVLIIGAAAAFVILDGFDIIDEPDLLCFTDSNEDKDDDENEKDGKDEAEDGDTTEIKEEKTTEAKEETTAKEDIPEELLSDPVEYFAGTPIKYYIVDPTSTLIDVYSECKKDSTVVGTVDEDTIVTVYGEYNNWLLLEFKRAPKGYGWAEKKHFSLTDEEAVFNPNELDKEAVSSLTETVNDYLSVAYPHPDCTYFVGDKNDLEGTSVYELSDGEVAFVYGYLGDYAYIKVSTYYGWCDSSCFLYEGEESEMTDKDINDIIRSFSSQTDSYYKVYDTGYSGLNLRKNPDTDAEIIKVLQESEIVLVYGIKDGWAFVKTDDPRTERDIYGWCSSEFLQYYSAY